MAVRFVVNGVAVAALVALLTVGCTTRCSPAPPPRLELSTGAWFAEHPRSSLEVCLDDRCVQALPAEERRMRVTPAAADRGGQPRTYLLRVSMTESGTEIVAHRAHVRMRHPPTTTVTGCRAQPDWIATARLSADGNVVIP